MSSGGRRLRSGGVDRPGFREDHRFVRERLRSGTHAKGEEGAEIEPIRRPVTAGATRPVQVISALETLESMANNNDKENEEIHSLQKTVDRLETEKTQRARQGRKLEEEMELIEETYRKDIADLRNMVKALTSENASLSSTVSSLPHNMDSPTTMASKCAPLRLGR